LGEHKLGGKKKETRGELAHGMGGWGEEKHSVSQDWGRRVTKKGS